MPCFCVCVFFVVVVCLFVLLEGNCFIILCWFLAYINTNQPQVYICPLSLEPPSHLLPYPTPRQVVTEHQIKLPVSHSKFPLSICFTYGNVYVSSLLSQFIPPSPSRTVFTSLFSMSASLLLPCKQVHQYHLSRFHTHALIYNICLSLSDLLHSVQQALGSSISLGLTQMCSF